MLMSEGLNRQTRQEQRPDRPGARASNRTWYYINYRQTIDAIKWRVYTIDKEVQGTIVQTNEKKEYFCNHCKAEWTAMEVLDNVGPSGFLCHRCGHTLKFEADRTAGGHEQSTRLNDQFKFITEQLRYIDQVHVPECDFDRAFAKARPVERDATHQRIETIAVDGIGDRPMAVKGLTNTGPQSIAVNISTSEGPSQAEQEAERARKEQAAKQNALPIFFEISTVSGESFSGNAQTATGTAAVKQTGEATGQDRGVAADTNANTQMDDFFAGLKAEHAAEAARRMKQQERAGSEEDDDEDEDEDDGEFEDVPTTGAASGAASSDERQAKRVKIEPDIKQEDDEDDEELEFEDV
jgi:transcription initiation factor TFIIE subunit alpha